MPEHVPFHFSPNGCEFYHHLSTVEALGQHLVDSLLCYKILTFKLLSSPLKLFPTKYSAWHPTGTWCLSKMQLLCTTAVVIISPPLVKSQLP